MRAPWLRRARRTASRLISRNMLGFVGMLICLIFVGSALLAPVLAPYDPFEQDYEAMLQGPSPAHALGTDDLGRDTLSRILYGAQVSLQVGLVAVGIAILLGVALGLSAGYWGGWVDNLIMRVMDALYAFPTLVLAIAIVSVLGTNLFNAMLAIGIAAAPRFARLVRGQVLSLREREFVTAARGLGATDSRILLRHILPNTLGIIIVQAALNIAFAILTEASLSFLGLGVQPPTPSWGTMLRFGYGFLEQSPWVAFTTGAAITMTIQGFGMLGDGLRDMLDPTLSRRQ
jgi:peptide/nickel transport system permease protein